ncbi:MAG: type II secretion system minor pseudopilin GspJ [Pseudomonadota bacterium]
MRTFAPRPASDGFTLLELVVALAVFATLSVMAYGGLGGSLRAGEALEESAQQRADLQRAIRLIEQDFRYPVARPVRDQYGDPVPSLLGTRRAIALTRAGWANPAAAPRSSLQRVEYRWQRGTLTRLQWASLDRSAATPVNERELLDGLERLSITYHRNGRWLDVWPPANGGPAPALPDALRVELEHPQFGAITRVFALDTVAGVRR